MEVWFRWFSSFKLGEFFVSFSIFQGVFFPGVEILTPKITTLDPSHPRGYRSSTSIPRRWWSVFMPWRCWKSSQGWTGRLYFRTPWNYTVTNQFALENQWLEYSLIENSMEKVAPQMIRCRYVSELGQKDLFSGAKKPSRSFQGVLADPVVH